MSPQEAQAALSSMPQSAPLTPAQAQAALSSMPADNTVAPQQNNMGFLPSLGAHALADVADYGNSLINIPHNLSGGAIPGYQPGYDYHQALGVQPNLADTFATDALKYMPAGLAAKGLLGGLGLAGSAMSDAGMSLGSIPSAVAASPLAQTMATGGLYGAGFGDSNSGLDTGINAVEGTGLGAITHGAGLLANSGLNYAANAYAKSAIPGLINRGGQAVMAGLGNAGDYVKQLLNQYGLAKGAENNAWNMAKTTAANLDNQLPIVKDSFGVPTGKASFDSSPYDNYVNNFINKVDAMPGADKPVYQQAQEVAQNVAADLSPKNFTQAVNARQNLNAKLKDYLNLKPSQIPTQPNTQTTNFINGLKGVLDNDLLDKNAAKVDPNDLDYFKQMWGRANQATQEASNFNIGTNSAGASTFNSTLNSALKTTNPDAGILNQFIPSAEQTGTNEYENLADLYGSQQHASDALKSYALRNAANKGQQNQEVMKLYSSQSPEQRAWMFGGSPGEANLSTAQDAISQYGLPTPGWKGMGKNFGMGLLHSTPLAAAGTIGGVLGGQSPEHAFFHEGVPLAVGGKIGSSLVSRYATPAAVQRAMQMGATKYTWPSALVNKGVAPLVAGTAFQPPQPLNLTLTNYAGTQ